MFVAVAEVLLNVENRVPPPRLQYSRRRSSMMVDSALAYSDLPVGTTAHAYNEAAFRHFLAVERRRAAQARRCVVMVLVVVRHADGRAALLSRATGAAVFRGLSDAVREIDFVGWYRDGRIAAAALTHADGARSSRMRQLMVDRIVRAIRERLSADDARRLRVRVVPLGGPRI